MRRISMAVIGLAVHASVACIWTATAVAGSHPPDRHGFMIGFGAGGASLDVEARDGNEGSANGNFRIGYAVRPDLVIHYEGNTWVKVFNELRAGDVTWVFTTNTAALTYYPPGTGIFLRGGIGLGTAVIDWDTPIGSISSHETGLGLLAAAGYEWRLTTMFALAPEVNFVYQDLDQLGSASLVGGSLGFNWYW